MIEKEDVFELDNDLYCVFDQINYNGRDFCFCNKMDDEKTFGANFFVFENFEDGIELVEDEALLNELSPIFTRNINIEAYTEDEEE